jgi:hypothetical protein
MYILQIRAIHTISCASMKALLFRMRSSIEESVGPINYDRGSNAFRLVSDFGDRISVAIFPDSDDSEELRILYKGEIIFPDESELPIILLKMKNGTYPVPLQEEWDSDDDSEGEDPNPEITPEPNGT